MITHVSYREATFQGESQVADGMKQWTDLGWRVSKVERVSGRRFVVRFRALQVELGEARRRVAREGVSVRHRDAPACPAFHLG